MSFGTAGPWRLRGTSQDHDVFLGRDAAELRLSTVVPGDMACWNLEHWLASDEATLMEIHHALGGVSPSGLSTLEHMHYHQRVKERLAVAFRRGELVVLPVELPRLLKLEPPAPTSPARPVAPPPRRASPTAEPADPPVEAAVQAAVLRQAAESGVPFCEECKPKAREPQAGKAA